MYDFYLGSPEAIANDEARYLVAVKRMMPRWINSLPDSEFLALAAVLDAQGAAARKAGRAFVAVETGAGASSLALAFYAMKYEGTAWSWDMNAAKGSAIRQVAVETMANHFGRHVNEHWRLVAYDSLSPYLGLTVLRDLVDRVDVTFHDSEHTWKVLGAELEAIAPLIADGGVIALDDANLSWEHTNLGYINTFRRKLGLDDVAPLEGNDGEPFHVRAARFFEQRFEQVEHLPDLYKERFREDPYFAYYDAEFDIKASLGTEVDDALEHRFDSWRVAGYRA